jgi:hypothetical protein
VGSATSTWLESIERSLVQMKEYQVCNFSYTASFDASKTSGPNLIAGSSQEARAAPTSLRYLPGKDRESEEGGFSRGRRAA